MIELEDKPDLRELVGVAVNASVLVMRPEVRGPADMLVALGGAAQELRDGWVRADGKRVGADAPASSLAPLLWRLKFGRQATFAEAAMLLAMRIAAGDERFLARKVWPWPRHPSHGAVEQQRRVVMAAQVISEWCNERCSYCGGVGKQQLVRARGAGGRKARRSGRAMAVLGAKLVTCAACGGSGRSRVVVADRARALGVTMEVYERRWSRRFVRCENELRRVVGRLDGPLKRLLRNEVPAAVKSSGLQVSTKRV